jgi:hypothetical protein
MSQPEAGNPVGITILEVFERAFAASAVGFESVAMFVTKYEGSSPVDRTKMTVNLAKLHFDIANELKGAAQAVAQLREAADKQFEAATEPPREAADKPLVTPVGRPRIVTP